MNDHEGEKPLVVFLTGVSGAGLKTGINVLEDSGMYCIDNLPIEMVEQTLLLLKKTSHQATQGVVFGIHVHCHEQLRHFEEIRNRLQEAYKLDTLFLSAEDAVLELRYSANRRKHPLLTTDNNLSEAFRLERLLTKPLMDSADMVIETSQLSPQKLGRLLENRYFNDLPKRSLYVSIASFGFKRGQLRPADSIFDVRFLKNPYFQHRLRHKTGLDPEVSDYVFSELQGRQTLQKILDWHQWVLPRYFEEGKHYFRIGIGCTGGRHRSVAIVEALYSALNNWSEKIVVTREHRDSLL